MGLSIDSVPGCSLRAVKLRVPIWLLLVVACREAPGRSNAPGQLEVQWEGSSKGQLSGLATASWCDVQRVLAIRTVRGDTGIALALYPEKALTPGAYSVVEPARAESVPPAAAVAARWPTKSVIQGFRGDSGQVILQRSSAGRFSGQVSARARSVVDTQRIVVTGTFRDVLVQPDSLGCEPEDTLLDEAAEDPDTGVH
jgi:hypothetical protein